MSFTLRAMLAAAIALALFQPFSFGDLYRWKDAEGTIHITEDPSSIPPEYRDETRSRALSTDTRASLLADLADPGVAVTFSEDGLRHFEVPYAGYEGMARRIIIPVTINKSVTTTLLLDTGAPGLVIAPHLAERLGLIDPEEGGLIVTTGGVGGEVPATLTAVDSIQVGAAYAEFLPATITPINSEHFEGLVGMDFLAGYRISIDTSRNVLVFDELPMQQNMPGGHDEIWWRSNFHRIAGMKEAWRRFLIENENGAKTGAGFEQRKKLARHQYSEAEKLYDKLERFASENSVPAHWRQHP
ncbi:MAG: retroviral-like aspartic protease family protein [Acidobacteriota bacterium]|nr:retroviral-like aspartic protease family protein [Acidobacteriota bacterium]